MLVVPYTNMNTGITWIDFGAAASPFQPGVLAHLRVALVEDVAQFLKLVWFVSALTPSAGQRFHRAN